MAIGGCKRRPMFSYSIFVSKRGRGYVRCKVQPARVVRPIIKVIANFSKVCCYLFHFLFPTKRFSLPSRSSPLFGRGSSFVPRLIPQIMWQTNYTSRVTLPVYLNYLFNRLMAPTFAYRFMVTEEHLSFAIIFLQILLKPMTDYRLALPRQISGDC